MRVQSGLSSAHLRPSTRGRAGYTLVELVVVMGIIAALAALILGAVSKAKDVGDRTKVRAELSQLDTATAAFKKDFGFNPPQIVKFPTPGTTRDALQEKTAALLSKMFRGYNPDTVSVTARDSTLSEPNNLVALDGQTKIGVEALVFFLGGPHLLGQAPTGFASTTPQAPLSSANSKKGPYYEFAEARFIDPEMRQQTLQYRDVYGTPYAYFSSGTAGGDKYDATLAATWQIPDRPVGTVLGAFRLGGNAASPWANPGRVQIISAGADKMFGTFYTGSTRGEWKPGQGEYSDLYVNPATNKNEGFGADDLANFNGSTPLGVAGN